MIAGRTTTLVNSYPALPTVRFLALIGVEVSCLPSWSHSLFLLAWSPASSRRSPFRLTSAANGRAAQHVEPDPVRPVHRRPRFRVTSLSPGEA
jgi:hypothetical protein